jgi:hypothetical protein
MKDETVVTLALWSGLGLFSWWIFSMIIDGIKRNSFTVDDNQFSQAGVKVNFSDGTIEIEGNKYSVNLVKSTRWESGGRYGNKSCAFIEVEDFKRPSYTVGFNNLHAAEKFTQRLWLALEKAGQAKG